MREALATHVTVSLAAAHERGSGNSRHCLFSHLCTVIHILSSLLQGFQGIMNYYPCQNDVTNVHASMYCSNSCFDLSNTTGRSPRDYAFSSSTQNGYKLLMKCNTGYLHVPKPSQQGQSRQNCSPCQAGTVRYTGHPSFSQPLQSSKEPPKFCIFSA